MQVRVYVPGEKISEPGVYRGVPMDVYHGDCCIGPSVSSSHLRKAETSSMDEVWDTFYLNPDRDPEADKDKKHYILGRAAHTLLLGEEGFREDYLIRPETYPDDDSKPWSGNSKSCKAWLAEAALAGKSVITKEQVEVIRGIAGRMASHPTIQTGILNGLIEHSIFWIDEKTGLWVKCRPDAIPTDSNIIADLKVQAGVQPIDCRRAITEYGYHQQMALIGEGMFHAAQRVVTDFVLVMAKAGRPFSINHKPLTPSAIYRGHQQNRRAMDRIAECLKTGYWPGPDDDEVPADLQDWREKQLKYEEEHKLLPEIEEINEAGLAHRAKAVRRSQGSQILDKEFPPEPDEAV